MRRKIATPQVLGIPVTQNDVPEIGSFLVIWFEKRLTKENRNDTLWVRLGLLMEEEMIELEIRRLLEDKEC